MGIIRIRPDLDRESPFSRIAALAGAVVSQNPAAIAKAAQDIRTANERQGEENLQQVLDRRDEMAQIREKETQEMQNRQDRLEQQESNLEKQKELQAQDLSQSQQLQEAMQRRFQQKSPAETILPTVFKASEAGESPINQNSAKPIITDQNTQEDPFTALKRRLTFWA